MKKLIAIAIAVTVVASAGTVGANTDLQAQIDALLAQIAQLQAQLAGTTTTPVAGVPASCAGVSFTRNLSAGATGNDVKCLQALLNADVATQVAASGVGSTGMETTTFGPMTRNAVVKFQNKYASEVLTPVGLTTGTGFVGAQTRAKLNAMLTSAPTTPTDPTTPTTPTTPTSGTEGDLEWKLLAVPSNTTEVKESQTGVSVMSFELKAKDSDIVVRRLDLRSTSSDGGRPSLDLSNIGIYDGTTLVMGVSASSFARPSGQTYWEYRYDGLNITVPKGTTKTLTVKVDSLSSINNNRVYTFTVPQNGIRFTDTLGINSYVPTANTLRSFTMKDAETGELELSLNSNSPKEAIVFGSETSTKEGVELLRFDLKAKKQNVTVDSIKVVATTTATSASEAIVAVKLYDGSTLLGTETVVTDNVTFTDLDLSIAKDATKVLTVKVDVRMIDGTYIDEGDAVWATVAGATVSAEDSNYADVTTTGSATGERQYMYVTAPSVSNITTSITANKVSDVTVSADGRITFTLTAQGGDIVFDATTTVIVVTGTTTNGQAATTTAQYVEIGGKALNDTTALADRTITNGSSKVITAEARVATNAGNRGLVAVTKVEWQGGSLPTTILETLKTANIVF